jgi:saccharopine dehydrogenase-like NADP-dependent oxidoreductase
MKQIVLFGAGKSSGYLIEYLLSIAANTQFHLWVADANETAAQAKTGNHPNATAIGLNIENEKERQLLIQKADLVISLLPPHLHFLVAKECIAFGKNFLTASYVDAQMKNLEKDIQKNNLLFLCEMGLDPGIDHMSAMQMLHHIHAKGGNITSFASHCGGLVAAESDDNPWHYKISWNPRNIVLAGKGGAVYKKDGKEIHVPYEKLFENNPTIQIPSLGTLAYYYNRDSLRYASLYNLNEVSTFMRTTLRHTEFCLGWNCIIELKLTDEEKYYETDGLSIADFFKQHFRRFQLEKWLSALLYQRLGLAKDIMEKLSDVMNDEISLPEEVRDNFLMVDGKGNLTEVNINHLKSRATGTMTHQLQEANLILKQLFFLGLDDHEHFINKGLCSAADVLQFLLETRLALQPNDKDLVVMLHEITYTLNNNSHTEKSCLIVKGENSQHTAMAKTVGLPLGIAAKLICQNKIPLKGLHIPTLPQIYEPVLKELESFDIQFKTIE